jgi:hypothetical protein
MRFYRSSSLALLLLAAALAAPQAIAQVETAPLGTTMPEGPALANYDGTSVTLAQTRGERATVVLFASNGCPWIGRYDDRTEALITRFAGSGVSFVLVNPGDPTAFPRESAEENRTRGTALGAAYYLSDPEMTVARSLGAERTPHAFVFDASGTLVYVGSIDDSPSDAAGASKNYLGDALDAVLAGEPVAVAQTKPFGCMIKY